MNSLLMEMLRSSRGDYYAVFFKCCIGQYLIDRRRYGKKGGKRGLNPLPVRGGYARTLPHARTRYISVVYARVREHSNNKSHILFNITICRIYPIQRDITKEKAKKSSIL